MSYKLVVMQTFAQKYAIDFVSYALVCLTALLYLPYLIYATPFNESI